MTTTAETDVKYPGRRVRSTRTGETGRVTGYDLDRLHVEYDGRPGQDCSGPAEDFEVIAGDAAAAPVRAEDDPEVARIIRNMKLLSGVDDDPLGLEGRPMTTTTEMAVFHVPMPEALRKIREAMRAAGWTAESPATLEADAERGYAAERADYTD